MIRQITLLSADLSAAGRFDVDSMPEQTRMEALVGEVRNLSMLKNANDDFRDIISWTGVVLDTDGRVTTIDFEPNLGFAFFGDSDAEEDDYIIGPGGRLDVGWIPRLVLDFCIASLHLEGSIETALLPPKLKWLNIAYNKFTGSFAFENLPDTMEQIIISNNLFFGHLCASQLPKTTQFVRAGHNDFDGGIELHALPTGLILFDISFAKLSGSIDLTGLPKSIRHLNLSHNQISQETLMVDMRGIQGSRIRVDKEKFGKIINVSGQDMYDILI